MPSVAFQTYKYNFSDVDNLVGAYDTLKPTGRGRRGLGYLTRSTVLTLCACWEQYIEDVIIESVEFIQENVEEPGNLPKPVQKTISKKVKLAKHELKPLELAGAGWKKIYLDYAVNDVHGLHSPKTENIQQLLDNYVGITDQIGDAWSYGKGELDKFIAQRNKITHKGKAATKYIKFYEVRYSVEMVEATVRETDRFLSDHLALCHPNNTRPWNRPQQ